MEGQQLVNVRARGGQCVASLREQRPAPYEGQDQKPSGMGTAFPLRRGGPPFMGYKLSSWGYLSRRARSRDFRRRLTIPKSALAGSAK